MANDMGLLPDLSRLPLAPSQASGAMLLENDGDADAYPVWEVRGPGRNFVATSPRGEVLAWNGTLAEGVTLTIDTERGTAIDSTGANRYAEFGPAPVMWTIPPGTSEVHVSFENTSPGRWEPGALQATNEAKNPGPSLEPNGTLAVYQNLIINPSFETGTSAVSSGSGVVHDTVTTASTVGNGTRSFRMTLTGATGSNGYAFQQVTLPAGSVGSWLAFSLLARRGAGNAVNAFLRIVFYDATNTAMGTWSNSEGFSLGTSNIWETPRQVFAQQIPEGAVAARVALWASGSLTGFTAPADSAIYTDSWLACVGGTEELARKWAEHYFDGDTSPYPDLTPSWDGTAGASTSTLSGAIPRHWAGSSDPRFLVRDEDGLPAVETFDAAANGAYLDVSGGSGANGWFPAPQGQWVAIGVDLKPLNAVASRSGRITIAGYNGVHLGGVLGNNSVEITPPEGEWSRHVHVAQITNAGTNGYLRLLVWPLSAGHHYRARRYTIAYASTRAAALAAATDYFDGDIPDGPGGIYRWADVPYRSTSSKYSAEMVGASRVSVTWRPRRWLMI